MFTSTKYTNNGELKKNDNVSEVKFNVARVIESVQLLSTH